MNTQNIIDGLSILYPSVEFAIQDGTLSWTDGPAESLISDILDDVGADLLCNRNLRLVQVSNSNDIVDLGSNRKDSDIPHYRVWAERWLSTHTVCEDHLPNVKTRIVSKNEVINGRCVFCRTGAPVLESQEV